MSELPHEIPDKMLEGGAMGIDETLTAEKLQQEVAALEGEVGVLHDISVALDQIEKTTDHAGQDVILGEVFK